MRVCMFWWLINEHNYRFTFHLFLRREAKFHFFSSRRFLSPLVFFMISVGGGDMVLRGWVSSTSKQNCPARLFVVLHHWCEKDFKARFLHLHTPAMAIRFLRLFSSELTTVDVSGMYSSW
jgi:hypothetical protein